MPGTDSRWTELTDQNERFIRPADSRTGRDDIAHAAARAQWAELASQRERLADTSDPLFGLVSSRHGKLPMRRVITPA